MNTYLDINSIPLYLWAIGAIGRKGIEPSTVYTIEFTAQPVIPTNGTFLRDTSTFNKASISLGEIKPDYYIEPIFLHFRCIVKFNQSRAISTTRTVFRLNTNQSHAYEDPLF